MNDEIEDVIRYIHCAYRNLERAYEVAGEHNLSEEIHDEIATVMAELDYLGQFLRKG